MLKGKLKKEFEEWYVKEFAKVDKLSDIAFDNFYNSKIEHQKGVIEAFLKYKDLRVEIVLGIDLKTGEFDGYDWAILKINKNLTVKELYSGWNEFEVEAFEEGINQLNEILN